MTYSKVYAFVLVTVLGWVGIADIVSESEASILVDHIIELVGIVGTLWARYKSSGEPINVLGVKRV